MPFLGGQYYIVIIILQAICVIHCLRRGTQYFWIWLIIFLPLVGCLAYIFTQMSLGRDMRQMQSGLGSIFNPSGRISRLEENLKFSDTFQNRILLADAYLAAGQTGKAISLYESSLTGTFTDNEHVHLQLITAYFEKQRYDELIAIAKKIYKLPQFMRSRAHMQYAMALERTGQSEQAEREFKMMQGRFAYFESRYQYGLFLLRAGRKDEARQIFADMIDESRHLTSRERRNNYTWFNNAKGELKKT